MPIYKFHCSCGCEINITYDMDRRDTPTPCPDCGEFMARSYQLGGISFKGSGWGKD